jgi:hypothetical protein
VFVQAHGDDGWEKLLFRRMSVRASWMARWPTPFFILDNPRLWVCNVGRNISISSLLCGNEGNEHRMYEYQGHILIFECLALNWWSLLDRASNGTLTTINCEC